MAKPTLLQTLLGRPSQTYAFPRENEYHVAKHDLLRSLAERKESTAAAHAIRSRGESPWPAGSGRNMTVAASSSQQSSSSFAVPTDRDLISRHLDYTASLTEAISATTDDDDENEIFYTPDTSPRMSLVTSSPNVIHPSLLPLDPSFSTTSLSSTVVSSSSSMSAPTIFSSTSLPHSTSTRTTPMNSDSVCDASASSRSSPSVYASPKVEYTRPKYVPLPCPDPERSTDRWRRSPQPSSHNPKATITPMRKSDRHSLSDVYSQKPRVYNSSRQPSRKNWSKAIAKNTPSIMMSMTALLEEDEERERESDRSNAMIVESKVKVGSGSPRPNGYAPTRPRSTSPRSSAVNTKIQAGPSRQESPHDQKRPHHPRSRSKSPRRRSSMSSSSLTSTTVSTPPIPSIPSHGTPGYTSLTLPRAPPPASLSLALASSSRARTLSGGRIDLTRSGIAQTTMASVEVVKGLAGQSNGWGLGIRRGRLERRRTVSGGEVGSSTDVRGDAPLAFTGHRGPPAYVDSGSVLVQVWAVGIDGMDEILVGGKGKEKADVGFIPGRSFVGRVLECGWDVKDIDARKGEWVMGLMDIRKCGVLAEFIVVERHRILRVPHPSMRSVADIPSRSSKSNKKATLGHRTNLNTSLTLEEFSLLPLCGVPAYRAVRTFVLGLPDEAEKCGRVLVLRGQAGIGGLAVQILVKRGWRVCVHAPMPCRVVDEKKYMKEIEDRARGWGADEVVFDDGEAGAVVRTIERLIEDGEQFDAVLDTVGGRAVWEAGERLLRSGECGLFTTLVGDVPERVIPRAVDHFKAGVRSLRLGSARKRKNSGVNRRNGTVGYAWVSVGQDVDWEGEDVRESLRAVLRIALENGVKPWTGRAVPFERAPEVFFKDDRDTLRDGGTVVVKVVG